jgi:hypothetical protein
LSCKCEVCKGQPPQTRLWCIDHHRHVHEGHGERNVGHKVVRLDPWPPKRRGQPKRLLRSPNLKLLDTIDFIAPLAKVKYPQPSQEEIGDCTAETAALDRALMRIKQGLSWGPFSVAFIYAEERLDIGTFPDDSGANMVDEGNALALHGVCLESTMPTSGLTCNTKPSDAAVAEALQYKCDPNQKPIDYRDFQLALSNAQQEPLLGTVRMGFPVGESFFDAATNGGWVPNTPSNDSLAGGHSEYVGRFIMLKGPNDPAPRRYVDLVQTWGVCGDMTPGLSTFHLQYPEFWETAFVQNNGGTDNYQQPDLPSTPPPPGTLTLSVTPSSIPNDGSGTATFTLQGLTVGNAFEVAFGDSTGAFVFRAWHGLAANTTETGTFGYAGPFTGSGFLVAADVTATPNIVSNSTPFSIYKPSTCPIGNGIASSLNVLAVGLHRQGRFRYVT